MLVRGAEAVAGRAITFARPGAEARPVLVNGEAGILAAPGGRPVALMAFTVADGKVVRINVINDRARLAELDLSAVD